MRMITGKLLQRATLNYVPVQDRRSCRPPANLGRFILPHEPLMLCLRAALTYHLRKGAGSCR